MKVHHYVMAGFAVLAGVCVTAYAHLPQDSYYEYHDPVTGGYVGWKYVSCAGHTTGGGVRSGTITVEHTPCGDEPGTGFPVDGSGGAVITQSCGGEGQLSC